MREIKLNRGMVAIVDDEDFDRLNAFAWTVARSGGRRFLGTFYARRHDGDRRYIYMHGAIVDVPPGMTIDHGDGNGLNNRRKNLRIATFRENSANAQKTRRRTVSRFKGVSVLRGRWRAYIFYKGRQSHLGFFETEEAAARAYDAAARDLYGDFARTNFSPSAGALVGRDLVRQERFS